VQVFPVVFPDSPYANALGMMAAWGLSNIAGVLFHRYVETVASDALARSAPKISSSTMRSD
jgi:hypothetical protein